MQERFLKRLKGYGSMNKSYGCFSLRFGVLHWSFSSLILGVGLFLFISLVDWKTQNIIHFSFEVQKEMRATLNLGPPPKQGQLEPLGDYDAQLAILQKETETLAARLDWWIKKVVWLYAFLCTIRGVVGCIGVGLKDPALIKSLWHMTIFGFFVDTLLCAAFPIAVCFQGIRLAWYFWLWLICPLIYVPYIASYTCEMIFSYYRVLDMGGTGAELASPADLEALLLPDRQGSLASGNT